MSRAAGVWIDHWKAVVVVSKNGEITLQRVQSNIDRRIGRSDAYRCISHTGAKISRSDDTPEMDYIEHLNSYYDEVIGHLRDTDSVLILGPGELKKEFKMRILQNKLKSRVDGNDSADRITINQFIAEVQHYFQSVSAASRPVPQRAGNAHPK